MVMFLAVIVLVLPLCVEGKLTEVQKCFTTTSDGIKIGDSQCDNAFEDSVCTDVFETPINNGLTNAQVDQKCYEDECVSGGCLKRCLLCCEDCKNEVSDATCRTLRECGGCTSDSLKEMMIKNCPKACGYCGLRNKSSTTTSSTATTPTTSTSTTTKRPKPCGEGWQHCEECHMCYLLESQPIRTINESIAHCQQKGALLASPKSQIENDFIAKMYHAGVVYLGTKRRDDPKWIASNGIEQNYFSWNTDEPNGDNSCILLEFPSGLWSSYSCNIEAGFTCEKEEGSVPSPCDAGWLHCAECHLCYLVVTTALDVDQGIAYCQQRNSLMSSPKSQIENDFIAKMHPGGYHYLGTKLKLRPKWISSGGVEVNYSKWQTNHPIEGNQCILFHFTTGEWQSYPCNGGTGLVCQMDEGEH